MSTPAERLRKMAIDAKVQYGQETISGGEPAYPSWADDMMSVLEQVAIIDEIPQSEVERVIKASLPDGRKLGINWTAVAETAAGRIYPPQILFNAAEVMAVYYSAPGLRPAFVPAQVYRQAMMKAAVTKLGTDEINAIIDRMPDGMKGFLKSWGLMQFAEAVCEAIDSSDVQQAQRITRWQQVAESAENRAQAAVDEIERLRVVLADLIAVCAPNIYPSPDKPDGAWAVLQRAKAALRGEFHAAKEQS